MEKLSHWVQILSGIVLIVGVVLVLIQMEQTERLTRAQITSDWFIQRAAQSGTSAGENPMYVYAKLCNPETRISEGDAAVLHALFLQRFFMGLQGRVVSEVAGYGDAFWKSQLQSNMALVVSTPQGREWFESVVTDTEVLEIIRKSPFYGADCDTADSPLAVLKRADDTFKAARP